MISGLRLGNFFLQLLIVIALRNYYFLTRFSRKIINVVASTYSKMHNNSIRKADRFETNVDVNNMRLVIEEIMKTSLSQITRDVCKWTASRIFCRNNFEHHIASFANTNTFQAFHSFFFEIIIVFCKLLSLAEASIIYSFSSCRKFIFSHGENNSNSTDYEWMKSFRRLTWGIAKSVRKTCRQSRDLR